MREDIGKLIRKKREELGLKQEQLAKLIKVTPATISLYESGRRKPEIEKITLLSKALSTTEIELLDIKVPNANLDIALRAQEELSNDDIENIKKYVELLKYAKRQKK